VSLTVIQMRVGAYSKGRAQGHLYRHITQRQGQGPSKSQLPLRVIEQVLYISTRLREGRAKQITSSCTAGNGGDSQKEKEPSRRLTSYTK
jgi:hypothetical protein